MSETLCKINKNTKSSIEFETVLWEKASNVTGFEETQIVLKNSIFDFEKIKIYWYDNGNDSSTLKHIEINISQISDNEDDPASKFYFVLTNSNLLEDKNYYRLCLLSKNTIKVSPCYAYDDNSTSYARYIVPCKVVGINKKEIFIPSDKSGQELVSLLWTNNSPDNERGEFTANLSSVITKYDFVRILWKDSVDDDTSLNNFTDWYIGKESFSNPNGISMHGEGTVKHHRTLVLSVVFRPLTSSEETVYTRFANIWGDQTSSTDFHGGFVFNKIIFKDCFSSNGASASNKLIPIAIYGVNYIHDERPRRISNDFLIEQTGWSDSTVNLYGIEYYCKEIEITQFDGITPVISIYPNSSLISIDEQTAYMSYEYAIVDTENMKLKLYSRTIPKINCKIHVEGVK